MKKKPAKGPNVSNEFSGLPVPDCPVYAARKQAREEGLVPAGQHAQMLSNLGVHVEPIFGRCGGFDSDDRIPQAALMNFVPAWQMKIAGVSPSKWPLADRKKLLLEILASDMTDEERDDLIAVAVAAHSRNRKH